MNCPLCHRKLLHQQEMFHSQEEFSSVCPQTVWIFTESPITHYRHSAFKGDYQEIIFVLPYKVTLMTDKYVIYEKGDMTDNYCHWDEILACPTFQIKSEQHLRDKIKTLITFS